MGLKKSGNLRDLLLGSVIADLDDRRGPDGEIHMTALH